MGFLGDGLTLFALLIPTLQSEWTPAWIALALLCVCGWVLIALDIRHPRKSDSIAEHSADYRRLLVCGTERAEQR